MVGDLAKDAIGHTRFFSPLLKIFASRLYKVDSVARLLYTLCLRGRVLSILFRSRHSMEENHDES